MMKMRVSGVRKMKFSILLLAILIAGCTTLEVGEETAPPIGYILHCIDYPESIFCDDS